MADRKQRAIAWFFAIIFIISSSIVSVAVIYEIIQSNKKDDISEQLNSSDKEETNVNALKGKPLAGFTPVTEVKELQKIDTVEGTGDVVKATDIVTVDYTGAIASTGVVFESSKDIGKPATFPLNEVIKGWTQGVPGMKVGGTRRLLIPSELAYGSQASPTIPANSALVFDITLHKIGE